MKNLWANCDNCNHKDGPPEFCYHCFATRPPSRWEPNKMNNLYAIGHILEMYAYYRKENRVEREEVLSISAAICELARSERNYDEEVKV